ncbi:MAG: ATP-binding protein [Gammaproteobacteria bacterium]|nr:ATP-binding protein [Gammaproteobacteria bacterium]MCY4181617.1 ATP-binding protein [Gammaproteobacteria bacterium]MCY4296023.1 ATP-binding protein [Gammaproteobacteria bacterium]
MGETDLSMRVANDLKELAAIAERVDEFCGQLGIGPAVAYQVNLSLDELLTNTINYGYADDAPHEIRIDLRVEAGRLTIRIEDDARQFDLSASDPEKADTTSSLDERRPGGLGIFLVHEMMDSVNYHWENNRNVVRLSKNIES